MSGKVIKHPGNKKKSPQKRIIDKLKLKYPRIDRGQQEVEPVPKDKIKFYNPFRKDKDQKVMKFSKTLEDEGYVKWDKKDLGYFYGACLDHVIYKSLKMVYGMPDFIAFEVIEEPTKEEEEISGKIMPLEWGYLIKGADGSCYEILKRHRDASTIIILWNYAEKGERKLSDKVKNYFNEFLKTFYNLVEFIDKEFNVEKTTLPVEIASGRKEYTYFLTNLYWYYLQAGKDMIELADTISLKLDDKHNELFSKGEFDDALNIFSRMGTLYVSAIVFFIMALEGFINSFYKLFLKPQFKHDKYNRSVWTADLDLRILHLSLYCSGFSDSSISPESDAYKQWLSIRPFRNNLFHANITKELESSISIEDMFFFTYNPLSHIKLRDKFKLHTNPLFITKKDSLFVMDKIEIIVREIIDSMDEDERLWVNDWIEDLVIPVFGKNWKKV